MNREDYDNEVLSQLNDLTVYIPSDIYLYNEKIDFLKYDIKSKIHLMPDVFNFKKILIHDHKPATFYILPKIHKEYVHFPKGRPISSTINTVNKGLSQLLDYILQPVMAFVPELIIDSAHLLILLEDLKLSPDRKYTLVATDIKSLYTELNSKLCMKHCCIEFSKAKNKINLPCDITPYHLHNLMKWSLNYSFVEYLNHIYYQHKGIQMGNNASVSIANITVSQEILKLFTNINEIIFRGRLVDDVILIVDSTDISDFNTWIHNIFTHESLVFTIEYSNTEINFIDLNIKLDTNNNIITSLYTKPMSKHQFLHYNNNHPRHLLKSLPYSQGLRVIRACSQETDRIKHLNILMNKFKTRNYPVNLINDCKIKLSLIKREDLLIPKTRLIQSHLRIHYPHILSKYNILLTNLNNDKIFSNKMYLVVPFYKNIKNFGQILRDNFMYELQKCKSKKLQKMINDLHICISYKKSNCLSNFIK